MINVYVIQSIGGPVRVGITTDIRGRLNNLMNQSPLPLHLAYVEEVECRYRAVAIERAAHSLLKEARSHGSWFKVSAETAITAVRSASQDPHSVTRWSEQRARRGDSLRALREARGWSAERMAQAVGASVDFVLAAENGHGCDNDRGRMRQVLETTSDGVRMKEPPTS